MRTGRRGRFPETGGVSESRVSGIDDLNLDLNGALLIDLSFASDGTFTGDITAVSATPEPTTLLLFGTTIGGLGLAARWRRRRQN